MERQQKAFLETVANPANPDAAAPPGTPAQNDKPATVGINPARTLVQAFQVITCHSRASELLSRYENRHDRQYTRALAGLRAHRFALVGPGFQPAAGFLPGALLLNESRRRSRHPAELTTEN